MGMKADGVLYLAAEFIDTFNEINKQVEKGAIKVAKNNQIKLSVDEKSLLTSIDKSLGSKSLKGFDLSGIIIPYLKKFSEEAPDDELGRKRILKNLQDDIGLVDIVESKAVKNNNLKAMSADDIASAVEEVNSLIYKDKLKSVNESPVKAITEIFLKHASNVKAEIQKQLLEEFGENVSKYGVSEKEANDKLSSIYDSLAKRAEKEFELGGRKNKVRLEDVATEKDLEKIQGYYSRLESLGSPISGKSKELGDMLVKLSDDVDSFREGLDDELYELSEDIYSYTEREKKLFEDVRKKSYISSRDKVNPTYSKNKEDTIEPIIETLPFTESTKKKDTVQDNKTQENNKALEQAKEITEAENKTTNIKKEQTQEIKKQNELLQEQKDKEKSLNKENTSQKTSKSSKPKLNKDFANDIADIFNLMQQEGTIPLSSSQKQVDEIEEEKEQAEQVTEEKERTVEKTKEQAQVEQQVTNELKEQKNVQQSLQEDSQENKKKSELETLEDIKKETKQITDQEQKTIKAKEESLKVTQEELKTEQEINDKKEKSAAPIDSIRPDSVQPLLNKENGETLATKEKKDQEEIQQKIVESKNKELKITEEIAEAEKQITTENQKQEEAEEKKPLIMLVNKGRKLADVKTKGKSNSEIQAQIEAKNKEKAKSNIKQSSNDSKQIIDKTEEAAAAAAAEADMKAAKAQKMKEDAEILAKLRKVFGVTENKANEESIQQIEVSSEQMQKLKKEIQEATESLKEYKEINDKIAKAQSDKDNYVISQQTIDEMVQAGALSSSIDMAEYIRSAYRLYKKSGNEDDEKVLKEALRQYKLPTKKKKYLSYLTDENGNRIQDENGKYKTEIKIGDAYRDDEYLYSKNGKKLKSYANDERYKQYIKQADDERRAYEKAQRKLPSLLEERQAGQKDFAEVSARIQQVLQETGLDAERVNEILAAINGNLTDEEAIWKVINTYIKEASAELTKQQNISEDTSTLPDSSTASASTSSSASTSKNKPSSIPSIPQIPNVSNANINQSEIDSGNEASNEARGFNLISVSAEEAAGGKKKFVEANKEVLQSIVGSMPKIEQEAKALEKVEDIKEESNKILEGSIEDKTNIGEEKKQVEEIARRRKEAQQQYENQFHTWGEDGQLSFLDKNDYDLQNEYLELQKQEAEQLAKQAEQNPPKVNIPIEGQISFTNEEDINKIANEVYENSFIANKDGQYSLFRNVEAASNWGQELKEDLQEASKTDFSNLKNQLSLKDWEIAIDKRDKGIEEQFKKINNSKSFLQNTDIPNDFLKKYENISTKNGEGYKVTSNLRELKNLSDELANVKTKLKVSFDEGGNLKSTADPFEVQELLGKYDELVNKIQNLKTIIQSPSSQESFLLEEFKQITKAEKEASDEAENFKNKTQEALNKTLTDKNFASGKDTDITTLDSYFKVGSSDNLDKVRSTVEELKILKEQLKASRADDGSLIGEPKDVSALIERYNTLSKTLQSLITQIKLPDSSETIGLKIAEDAKKAEKELDELKTKVDTVIGKSSLFEAQTLKTINAYGAFNGEEGKKTDLIAPDKLGEKYGDRFAKQQEQVQQLISKFREYKTAVEELETLRTSDNTTLEQLTEANDKVKNLKDNITTLSQTIKTSGIANASEEQLGALKNRLEIFLEKNPNLTLGIRQQIQEYIDILNSGASVSKTRYASMTADLNKFAAAQTSGTTIWEQMVGKMREGIAFLATKFSFYQVFNQFRQGFEVIHQFDDALTEMMKVSDETRLSLERYQKTTFDTADAIGTNALQIQNSTADFMRLGMGTNVLCSAV